MNTTLATGLAAKQAGRLAEIVDLDPQTSQTRRSTSICFHMHRRKKKKLAHDTTCGISHSIECAHGYMKTTRLVHKLACRHNQSSDIKPASVCTRRLIKIMTCSCVYAYTAQLVYMWSRAPNRSRTANPPSICACILEWRLVKISHVHTATVPQEVTGDYFPERRRRQDNPGSPSRRRGRASGAAGSDHRPRSAGQRNRVGRSPGKGKAGCGVVPVGATFRPSAGAAALKGEPHSPSLTRHHTRRTRHSLRPDRPTSF